VIKPWLIRLLALVSGSFLLANTGSAYYYFTYFNSTSSPYSPIVARFDLNTLSNNTVPFFVSSAGPSALYPGDSVAAIVSEMTAAANVWNGVSTSSIRLAYGGFFNPGTTETAAGIQIEFSDDIPPGLLAYTIPTVFGNIANGSSGPFIPVFLSLVELPSDYSNATYFNGPSYSEEFFLTLVHEFGHSLGLQHTLASSVMSTYDTTASTKANPLGADDIAGISLLYPAGNYVSSVASISGTVTMNGQGVNLASVVAILPGQPAIATLTNPDGTYQIVGIPTGGSTSAQYYVYVHPLPPPTEGQSTPDNIFYPHDSSGTFLPPNTGFATQFYPGMMNFSQAQTVKVTAGQVTPAINFNVNPAISPVIGTVRTFSYIPNTNRYVNAAPIMQGVTTTIAAGGADSSGLLQPDNSLTPGLNVGLLGSAAQIANLRAYAPGNPYVAVDVLPSFSATGPQHLIFGTPGNLYVRPSGFSVVLDPPPLVSAVGPAAGGNGNVAISGGNFTPSTQILFDGLPAAIQSQNSNILIVTPPPAPAGYTAAVAAFNADGQSSLFLNPTAHMYTFGSGGASPVATVSPSLIVRPGVIPAGAALTVDVQGSDTNFVAGVTTVGFGTSDVMVRGVNVTSSTHLTATVTPNVTISAANITVTTGLEVISQAVGSQIVAADPTQ
jgi:Matrixin